MGTFQVKHHFSKYGKSDAPHYQAGRCFRETKSEEHGKS